MRRDRINQIIVLSSESAKEFQEEFNRKMEELNGEPDDVKIDISGGRFSAVISYHYIRETMDCIADEFHAEGIRYLCRNCPYLDDPHDKRVKYCKCQYARRGSTHKDHECCEFFYKQLKIGAVKPREDGEI